MAAGILEMIFGGALVILIIALKLMHIKDALRTWLPHPKLHGLLHIGIHTVLGVVAVSTIVDPLIPGYAELTIHVPPSRAPAEESPNQSLPEHLRLRVAPVGRNGLAGGDRTCDVALNLDGSVQVLADLALLETHVLLELYDETAPKLILRSNTVYIDALARRLAITKTITLKEEKTNEARIHLRMHATACRMRYRHRIR